MDNLQSSSIKFFVLADSHAKFIPATYTTSSFSLITKSIPGLKWFDRYDDKLSVRAMLSLPEIKCTLSEASAILFFVGTNSVRVFPAREIIPQIQQVVLFIQQTYPHLSQHGKISISLSFPCSKTTARFPTEQSLLSNINIYNEQLQSLSAVMNFNILNFHITNNHLAQDNMHIHFRFRDLIINSIINYFDQVNQTISATIITPTSTSATDPTSSLSLPSDQTIINKKSKSRAVLDRKNKKRFEQLKLKRQQHTIKRKIHHQWTAALIKEYLDSIHVKYSRIPPVYNKILRIMFNNQHDQDIAAEQIGIDIFNENHYQEFVNKNR
ncbi:unnamed protein product [Rotaria socialis]|uniref:Uncharacterized protein n=1 Tax=Rotaria socialis TaxID=392032 RepID=A0A820VY45_9BILA|nr:unnamed protein product [Rotaria socialis]CAF3432596.1 unnamed protein product [Rotaria socialis]CAF3445332.1 unnamed protein product [Rotaria socialis]CAF3658145.1 unnamed protein product [Rotaria socialis]CAF4508347.1 unnamed protein product [Rotaria socialis]